MGRAKEGFVLMVGSIAVVIVVLAAVALLWGLIALAVACPLLGIPLCILAFFGLCVLLAGD